MVFCNVKILGDRLYLQHMGFTSGQLELLIPLSSTLAVQNLVYSISKLRVNGSQ
jgi:hypothetical protein